MPAFRFLALATLAFIVPGGAFLWHQQLARLEREAVRALSGPVLELAAGARASWTLDLGASTEDQAWPTCQRQPRLSVPAPDGSRIRARARYAARGGLPEAPAFLGADGDARSAEARDGAARFGGLWLSFEQPLVIDVEVEAAPEGAGKSAPVLAGQVSADYAFARELDRAVFWAFVGVGAFGAALLVFVERRRTGTRSNCAKT